MATSEDVKKLAALARLSVPEETLPKFAKEFDAILGYVGQLADLDIKAGEPLLPYTNIFQFPSREGDLLSVKQIISHD
jgi:aspartyl/glutamyl-tRNA(Asn/Gln) amidotransferase C subunit